MWSPDGRYLAYRGARTAPARTTWGDVVISDAAGNVLATFPADGWDIGWSPDSTRVAVWDAPFETVGVYGVDGARQTQITMPSGWHPAGDHDPAWLRDGTLAVDGVELPLDGGAAGSLDQARAAEWRDGLRRHDRPCAWTRPRIPHRVRRTAVAEGSRARMAPDR